MITYDITGTTHTHAGTDTPIKMMHFDSKEIFECVGCELDVSTTGYVGGDSAYTEIKFVPTYGLNFTLKIPGIYDDDSLVDEFSIITYGDWEIETLKNMLVCAAQALDGLTGDGIPDTTGWTIKRWYDDDGYTYMTTNPTVQECYEEYCQYCTGLYFKPVPKHKFGRHLCSRFSFKSIPYKDGNGRSVRRYVNIRDDSMNSMRIKKKKGTNTDGVRSTI